MAKSKVSGLLLLAVAGALFPSAAQSEQWSIYRNEKSGYRIDYPTGWRVIEARTPTDDTARREGDVLSPGILQRVTFREPEGKLWPGEFVVRVHEHDAGQTLDEWADSNNLDVHDDSLVKGADDTVLAGRTARRFSIFGFDHTGIAVAFVDRGKIYEIGYAGSNPNDPDIDEHTSIYEQMQRSFTLLPVVEAAADSFDLGGPCDDDLVPSLSDFYPRLAAASANEDHQQMIDLQKLYVRAMCSNLYRWGDLAQTYLAAGRSDMAIQVLQEMHRRGAEIKRSNFNLQETLAAFIETPEFQDSELGHDLQKLRMAALRRKQGYRRRLDALEPSARPSKGHVAEGACPFECCTFGNWEVLETTPLRDAPFGDAEIGSVATGDRVRAVTGEVHLSPAPVAVVHDHTPFARGEIIFVLDYLGEGFFRYWRDGEIGEEQLWLEEFCLRTSRHCWAEYIEDPQERHEPRWWVLIETERGLRGWTDRAEHFGNKDACG